MICIWFDVVEFKQVILYHVFDQEKSSSGMSRRYIENRANPSKDERRWTFLWHTLIFETTHFTIELIGSINKRIIKYRALMLFRWANEFSAPNMLNAYFSENLLFTKRVPCAIRPVNSHKSVSSFSNIFSIPKSRRKNESPAFSVGSKRPVDTMDEA